jgi:mannose-6-phosphate isomerase-like protein (cupin superfamily)
MLHADTPSDRTMRDATPLQQPEIRHRTAGTEFYTDERCYIDELSNSESDPAVSIAHARVLPGVTTRWHRLSGIAERYVILSGLGRVEVGELQAQTVGPGDVVLIPPDCRQRIACIGDEELRFLAVCTPRFRPEAYADIDSDVGP